MGKTNLFALMEAYRRENGIQTDTDFCAELMRETGYSISRQTLTKYKQADRKVPPGFLVAVSLTLDLKMSEMHALADAYFADLQIEYLREMENELKKYY